MLKLYIETLQMISKPSWKTLKIYITKLIACKMQNKLQIILLSCLYFATIFYSCTSEQIDSNNSIQNTQEVLILNDTIDRNSLNVMWKKNGFIVAKFNSSVDSIFIHHLDSIVTNEEIDLLNNEIKSDSFFVHINNSKEITHYSDYLYSKENNIIVFPIIDGSWNIQLIKLRLAPVFSIQNKALSNLNETGSLILNDSILIYATKSHYLQNLDAESRTLNSCLLNDIYTSDYKHTQNIIYSSKELWSIPNDNKEIKYINSDLFFQNTGFDNVPDSIIAELILSD